MNATHKAGGNRSPEWGGFRSFADGELLRAPELATPLRVLWNAYVVCCSIWGFPTASPERFASWMADEEGVTMRKGGNGRLRRVASGVALKQGRD